MEGVLVSEPRTAAGKALLAQAHLMHKRWPVTDGLIGRHDILAIEAEAAALAATPAPLDDHVCRLWTGTDTAGVIKCSECGKLQDCRATSAPLDQRQHQCTHGHMATPIPLDTSLREAARAAVLKKVGEEYHRQSHVRIDTPYHYEPTFEMCEDPLCVEVKSALI